MMTKQSRIRLGLLFMRGFVTIFDQQRTGFATASKMNCYGSDDLDGVGTAEWAPEVKHSPKNPMTKLLVICVIVMGVLIVVSITFLCILK